MKGGLLVKALAGLFGPPPCYHTFNFIAHCTKSSKGNKLYLKSEQTPQHHTVCKQLYRVVPFWAVVAVFVWLQVSQQFWPRSISFMTLKPIEWTVFQGRLSKTKATSRYHSPEMCQTSKQYNDLRTIFILSRSITSFVSRRGKLHNCSNISRTVHTCTVWRTPFAPREEDFLDSSECMTSKERRRLATDIP